MFVENACMWIGLLHLGGVILLLSILRFLYGEAMPDSQEYIGSSIADKDVVEYLPLLSNVSNTVLLYVHGRAVLSVKDHAFANVV